MPHISLDTSFYHSSTFAAMVNPRVQELIILPTEQCNFRCKYCYEDFAIGRMPPEIVNGIKSLITRRAPDLDILKLSWFGGEPLLEQKIILDVSAHALKLKREHESLEYCADMTTNGYLLSAQVASDLNAVGINDFQISLDGPQVAHDQTRIRRDGKGTFARIWNNLRSIRGTSLSLKITLRVHVHRCNYSFVGEFLKCIEDEFGSDPRFFVIVKPIEELGGPGNRSANTLSESQRMELRSILEGINSTQSNPRVKLWATTGSRPLSVCYASKPNSLVIRADGGISKCTVALSETNNRIGSLKENGTLDINQTLLEPWIRGLSNLDKASLECPRRALGGLVQMLPS